MREASFSPASHVLPRSLEMAVLFFLLIVNFVVKMLKVNSLKIAPSQPFAALFNLSKVFPVLLNGNLWT